MGGLYGRRWWALVGGVGGRIRWAALVGGSWWAALVGGVGGRFWWAVLGGRLVCLVGENLCGRAWCVCVCVLFLRGGAYPLAYNG